MLLTVIHVRQVEARKAQQHAGGILSTKLRHLAIDGCYVLFIYQRQPLDLLTSQFYHLLHTLNVGRAEDFFCAHCISVLDLVVRELGVCRLGFTV